MNAFGEISPFLVFSAWLLLLRGNIPLALAVKESSNSSATIQQQQRCGVYLAPSTIPGAGLGMFNGDRKLKPRDRVTPGETVVPVSDYILHNPELAEVEYFFGSYGWTVDMWVIELGCCRGPMLP